MTTPEKLVAVAGVVSAIVAVFTFLAGPGKVLLKVFLVTLTIIAALFLWRTEWSDPPPPTPTPTPTPTPAAVELIVTPPTASSPAPDPPIAFTLASGEQKVLFQGEASVAVDFSMVGTMPVMTLHLSSSAGNEPKAILGAGARFPLFVHSQEFCVSVIKVDFTNQMAQLQVDRTSQCGG